MSQRTQKMARVSWLPFITFAYGPERVSGWSALVIVLLARAPYHLFGLGIGWDDQHPLRPWPWITWGSRQTDKGTDVYEACVSFCGLFIRWDGFGFEEAA